MELNTTFKIDASSPWADEMGCAITVCDTEGIVLYQNNRSVEVNGDVRGSSLIPCHNERSREIISRLMKGDTNAYTIQKKGQRKLIYQTPWRHEGAICGLVEFSLVIPEEMPHYVRG